MNRCKCNHDCDEGRNCPHRSTGKIREALADILILLVGFGLLYVGLWITP